MPILPSIPEPVIKQFFLPSTASLPQEDQAWVKMDVSPMTIQDSFAAEVDDKPIQAVARVLSIRIKEWNFTEQDGTLATISYESVIRLGADLGYLSSQIPLPQGNTLTADQKKT